MNTQRQYPPSVLEPEVKILLEKGLISKDILSAARFEQEQSGKPLIRCLALMGVLSSEEIFTTLSQNEGINAYHKGVLVDISLAKKMPREVAQSNLIFPLSCVGKELNLAMVDPYDMAAMDIARNFFGESLCIKPFVASEESIWHLIEKYYPLENPLEEAFVKLYARQEEGRKNALIALGVRNCEEGVIQAVEALLHDAVSRGASDIHLEPEGVLLHLRYRLDGILKQIQTLHKDHWQSLNIRLKVLSGLNVGESYIPQSGGFGQLIGGRRIDFRVSTHPTVSGENMVIRLLDRSRSLRSLPELGFREDDTISLKNALKTPEGMILVTGPTGSGKTTTLYGMLKTLRAKEVNIMTLEDPVEYRLPMIRQTEINLSRDVTFSQGVRSILRQDPDVIFIGEIRDEETARMAVRSALTGHQVFGTLHTNSALGALSRLKDLGISQGMLAGNVIALMSQRLIRKLCDQCKKPDEEGSGFLAIGCPSCEETGYRGREAIAEILPFDTAANDFLASKASIKDLREHFISQGVISLKEHAWQKVCQGITSRVEAERIVGPLGAQG